MSSRITKIEAWALSIIERVKAGSSVEDARVELKREWPPSQKAARRIAGHANASFGSDALWIIGVDESDGVVGVQQRDLATWWPAVASCFDGIPPSFIDISLSIDAKTVVCLLFDTNRPPYVVKNPAFGSNGAGPVSLEVPWREGTSVRTSNRNDLIRILVPTSSVPEIEFLSGSGSLEVKSSSIYDSEEGTRISFYINVYLYPKSDSTIVIPFHKCRCILSPIGGRESIEDFNFTIYRPSRLTRDGGAPDSATMERTSNELIIHGPGMCSINTSTLIKEEPNFIRRSDMLLKVSLFIVNADLSSEIMLTLKKNTPDEINKIHWRLLNQ